MVRKKVPKSKSLKPIRIYKHMPRGYKAVDPARSANQARSLRKSYPKDANAIIVKVGQGRGKKRDVFPYMIASNNRLYG